MTDQPKVTSWFQDQFNMFEIRVVIGNKIYVYSIPNGRKIQGVRRKWLAGRFGFQELNQVKRLGRLIERRTIRPD